MLSVGKRIGSRQSVRPAGWTIIWKNRPNRILLRQTDCDKITREDKAAHAEALSKNGRRLQADDLPEGKVRAGRG